MTLSKNHVSHKTIDKIEYRVIKYLFLKEFRGEEIYEDMVNIHHDNWMTLHIPLSKIGFISLKEKKIHPR